VDWLTKIIEQWKVVATAPVPFLLAVGATAVLIWFVVNYIYEGRFKADESTLQGKD
jgi:hypothetical protein